MTNYDKIKGLTKEQLAKFLVLKTDDGFASPYTVGVTCLTPDDCVKRTLSRLDDEAEGDSFYGIGAKIFKDTREDKNAKWDW